MEHICYYCKHAKIMIFMGDKKIDGFTYHCSLNNYETIFSDDSPLKNEPTKFPECPYDSWEFSEGKRAFML